AQAHQQRAEVGVAQPQLPVVDRVLADLLGGVRGVGDDDLLRRDAQGNGLLVRLYVEVAVFADQLEQVNARQVAGAVVQVHVLGAGVGGVDRSRVRTGVPVVDRRVVLHAGVGALPGRLGD